jgi:hypothetical protein
MKRPAIILLVLCPLAGAAPAQDFGKGLEAYERGDYATALHEWQPLAEQGIAVAQYNLGVMYDNGQGVMQDYAAAVKWYDLAAAQGFADAQYNLGNMYAAGKGVVQDDVVAVKWYDLAAGRFQGYESEKRDKALRNRDIVTSRMTPAGIANAQRLVREWTAAFEKRQRK